jgi:hypothetical protein
MGFLTPCDPRHLDQPCMANTRCCKGTHADTAFFTSLLVPEAWRRGAAGGDAQSTFPGIQPRLASPPWVRIASRRRPLRTSYVPVGQAQALYPQTAGVGGDARTVADCVLKQSAVYVQLRIGGTQLFRRPTEGATVEPHDVLAKRQLSGRP